MPGQETTKSLISTNPDAYVDLFELYVGGDVGIVRFHNGKNFSSSIFFRSYEFSPLPIEHSGFEFSTDGKQTRPTLRVANIDGIITDYIKNRQDLVGSRIKRIKVFVKDLDDKNFPDDINPFYNYRKRNFADGFYGNHFKSEIYVVNRKSIENKYLIEFELSSPLDVENQFLPSRKILDNVCFWKYRGTGCNYGCIKNYDKQTITVNGTNYTADSIFATNKYNLGIPIADENNKEFWTVAGYNLQAINFRGDYDATVSTYVPGDIVLFTDSVDFDFLSRDIQASQNSISVEMYVCIQAGGTGKDPRLNKTFWVKDACSKSLKGCKLRWEQYPEGLPYGGFPGTRPFEFVV